GGLRRRGHLSRDAAPLPRSSHPPPRTPRAGPLQRGIRLSAHARLGAWLGSAPGATEAALEDQGRAEQQDGHRDEREGRDRRTGPGEVTVGRVVRTGGGRGDVVTVVAGGRGRAVAV